MATAKTRLELLRSGSNSSRRPVVPFDGGGDLPTLAGDIIVDDGSRRYLDRHFALTPVSTAASSAAHLRLTGVTKTTYELWGRAARFVGRAAELARLGQLADEAVAGRGSAVGLRGESGGGKSRLLTEFARQMTGVPVRWLGTSCEPYGARSPFLTAIVLLRKCLELEADAPVRAIVTKVRERATGLYAEEELEAAIISLLTNLPELHPFMMLPAPRRRSLAVNAAARLLLASAETDPIVLVVEDLQWIDPESHDVLDAVGEALAGTRVLLIATYRTEYRRTWRGPGLTEIHLGPLSHQASAEARAPQRITDRFPAREDFAPSLVVIPVISLMMAGLLIMVLSTFVGTPPPSPSPSCSDADEEVQVDLPVIDEIELGEAIVRLGPDFLPLSIVGRRDCWAAESQTAGRARGGLAKPAAANAGRADRAACRRGS